jgi:hypothetical protein
MVQTFRNRGDFRKPPETKQYTVVPVLPQQRLLSAQIDIEQQSGAIYR